MRKAIVLLVVVAVMVALLAGTAAAKQNGKGPGYGKGKGPALVTYNFKGTLHEVAADGSYVVVDATEGNKAAQQHLGVRQFGVTSDTEVEVDGVDADLSALAVGDVVHVQSKAPRDAVQFDARKISVEHEEESGGEEVPEP